MIVDIHSVKFKEVLVFGKYITWFKFSAIIAPQFTCSKYEFRYSALTMILGPWITTLNCVNSNLWSDQFLSKTLLAFGTKIHTVCNIRIFLISVVRKEQIFFCLTFDCKIYSPWIIDHRYHTSPGPWLQNKPLPLGCARTHILTVVFSARRFQSKYKFITMSDLQEKIDSSIPVAMNFCKLLRNNIELDLMLQPKCGVVSQSLGKRKLE